MSGAVGSWTLTHGLRVLAVILLVFVLWAVLKRTIPLAVHRSLVRGPGDDERAEQLRRAETVCDVILRTSFAASLVTAGFLVIDELGFSVAPVIAGLGIGGIAIGLGAQTVVKDAINGMFILGENQFGPGDIVTIAGVTGCVEDVNLRRTVLRAEDGTLYTVPNSAITVTGNRTRVYSGVSFEVAISFLADLQRAIDEIDRIGAELASDPTFGRLVLEAPHALRVESFEDTYLNLRVDGRALPGAGAELAGELRRRIKQDFDRLGIAYRGSPASMNPAAKESTP